MNLQNIHHQVLTIRNKLIADYAPEKILLFGSYANNTSTADSDIDLVIIKNGEETFYEKSRAVSKILRRSGVPLDILVYSQLEWDAKAAVPLNFEHHIANHSIVLYERSTAE